MAGITGKNAIVQIGLVVKDIETTKRRYAYLDASKDLKILVELLESDGV